MLRFWAWLLGVSSSLLLSHLFRCSWAALIFWIDGGLPHDLCKTWVWNCFKKRRNRFCSTNSWWSCWGLLLWFFLCRVGETWQHCLLMTRVTIKGQPLQPPDVLARDLSRVAQDMALVGRHGSNFQRKRARWKIKILLLSMTSPWLGATIWSQDVVFYIGWLWSLWLKALYTAFNIFPE